MPQGKECGGGVGAAAVNESSFSQFLLQTNPRPSLCQSIYLHNSHLLLVPPPPSLQEPGGLKIGRDNLIG